MARSKSYREKSRVRLRSKKLSGGNSSLYLDIYYNGVRHKEYLKMYLVPERTKDAREKNKRTLELAERVRAERDYSIQHSTFSSQETNNTGGEGVLFVDYMEEEVNRMESLRSKNYIRRYRTGIKWVRKYDSSVYLININKEWLTGFIQFLSTIKSHNGRLLNSNTIHEYLIYVANILNIAVREGLIESSPMKKLCTADKPKKYESKREYLTLEEIRMLSTTPSPSKYNDIRCAFLFSCFTGLRYSDIIQLRWLHLIYNKEGVFIDKQMQKTKERLVLPLNDTAISFLPPKGGSKEPVFSLPRSLSTTEMYLKVWTEFAGIDKHVTFHTARHSFAVNILSSGGDIYTLSRLMGHKRVSTTQIYADILDTTKKKTIDLLRL